MARIDLLTAQMRQRAISRVSVQSDEKMQLFDVNDQLLGSGAPLSQQTIREILTEISPVSLNGAPATFPYRGNDGEFEIAVAPQTQGFEIRTLSFASAPSESLQTHSSPAPQSLAPESSTPSLQSPPADDGGWYYLSGDEQIGPHSGAQIKSLVRSGSIRRGTYLWREGMPEWQAVEHSNFKASLPALPNPIGDPENTWYYRSITGQPVPLERAMLVEKFRSGELKSDVWVWQVGMNDWANVSTTELASAINARPVGMGMPTGAVAPIAPPTGGPRTLPGTGPYNVYGGGDPENTSGGGDGVELPRGAQGLFNLGAFLFPVFWCHSMGMSSWGTGVFLLNVASRFVPFVGIVKLPVCLYLGYMGNTLAWRNRRFNSIQDFKRCQFMWGAISGAIWGLILIAAISFGVWAGLQKSNFSNATRSTTFTTPSTATE